VPTSTRCAAACSRARRILIETLTRIQEMREIAERWRREKRRIAFVPTMGYLHDGHQRLLKEGRRRGERLVLSVFVNPTQFGPNEDLERYPRDLARDAAIAESAGTDVLFAPTAAGMYPSGAPATRVAVAGLTETLCGRSRPGHFDGVTTVVAKLLHIVKPHVALFGEKDFQQLVVVRRMVRDLDLDVEIAGIETVREPDGLAMSSRNVYLDPSDREAALSLSRGIARAREAVAAGERRAAKIVEVVRQGIEAHPQNEIDYVAVVDPETLADVEEIQNEARLVLAVRVRGTRLIDNGALGIS
jgi:pantoate--beta-alanine ligase